MYSPEAHPGCSARSVFIWRMPNLIDDDSMPSSTYGHGHDYVACVQEALNRTSPFHDHNIHGLGPDGKFTKTEIAEIEFLCHHSTFSKVSPPARHLIL